jgi:catechol 2,3-dioxygenase-like lactoylglutathione lyase family enzyme
MTAPNPRLTALAPQFLVDDLPRMIAFYRDVLGFRFGEPWQGFSPWANATACNSI